MTARLNSEFIIVLEGNPTTGYTWEAIFDRTFIKLNQKSYEANLSEMLGAGGHEKFSFTPIKIGKTAIVMRYKRPWESAPAQEKSFEITIEE